MKRERIVNSIVLAAVALLVGWIAANTHWTQVKVPTPLRGESARNPFYAAQRLAEALGARTEWRRSVGTLPQPDAIVVLSGWNWNLIRNRRERLERWVARGGRLVIDRSLIGGEAELERWAGIARHVPDPPPDAETMAPPDADQCRNLEIVEANAQAGVRASYSVCGLDPVSSLRSAHRPAWALRDAQGMQVARVRIGRGSVTLVNSSPFLYRGVFEFDHAALFVAATQMRRGQHILFLSEAEGASLFVLMWRHGAPVVLLSLALLAAALWRGAVRFGPLDAPPEPARRSLAEQIRGTGRFTLRFGEGRALHAAVVRAVREAAVRRIPGFAALQASERIAALARLTGFDGEQLAGAMHFTGSRQPGELRTAIALLESARRTLTNVTKKQEG